MVALFFSLSGIGGPLKNVPSPSGCSSTEGSRPSWSQYLKSKGHSQRWLLPYSYTIGWVYKPHPHVPAQPPSTV